MKKRGYRKQTKKRKSARRKTRRRRGGFADPCSTAEDKFNQLQNRLNNIQNENSLNSFIQEVENIEKIAIEEGCNSLKDKVMNFYDAIYDKGEALGINMRFDQ